MGKYMPKRIACALVALCMILLTAAPALAGGSGLIGAHTQYGEVLELFAASSTGTHVVTASSLNVRSGPGTGYSRIGRLFLGDVVQVVSISGDFCRIRSDSGTYGYVSRQYLNPAVQATPTPRPTATASTGVSIYYVNASALNVRSGPSTGYRAVARVFSGDRVTLLSHVNATWSYIRLENGTRGYVNSSYLTFGYTTGDAATAAPTSAPATPAPTATYSPLATPGQSTSAPESELGPGEIYMATTAVNMRSGPATGYASKRVLTYGTYVTLISKYSSSWYYVRTIDGVFGYVRSSYLRYTQTIYSTPTPTASPAIVNTGEKLYSYAQMKADIGALYERYPTLVTSRVAIGDTMWNEQIPAVCIGNVNASKALLIDGGIHGREYMSTLLIMKQMEYLLENQNAMYNGRTIGSMLNECCIWFVPMINPDGVRISQTGLAGLNATQKNNLIAMNGGSTYFERWKANGYGVDLNRNFDAGWSYHGTPSGEMYSGSYANSESETRAMVNFVQSHNNIKASINYHTTGNCIFWHYGQAGATRLRDKAIANELSGITGFYLRAENYTGEGGGFMDWMIQSRGLPSFTIELGPGSVNAPQDIGYFNGIWTANRDVPAFMLSYIIENL